jgi:tetratricopeptide (TPR) repeat protein
LKIQLQYDEHASGDVQAAFIRGAELSTWLQEISTWRVDINTLTCLVVPESIQSVAPAGLLVIFKKGEAPKPTHLRHPYKAIGEKLFIPLHAVLFPQLLDEELNGLLMWPYQVFHPTIGFVGYDASDVFSWHAVVSIKHELDNDWGFAHPGTVPAPALTSIQLAEEKGSVMEALQEEMHTQPLSDIPQLSEKKSNFFTRMFDGLASIVLKETLSAVNGITKKLPQGIENQPGFLNKLEEWLTKNLAEVEKRRASELQRLLDMFKDNSSEALKYAIPLSDQYLDRGKAAPSWKLGKRSGDFNLGWLGGGTATDAWDVSAHYFQLRERYQDAAKKELEQKNYRKAAYVYAHLLGDFQNAAMVLEEGRYYSEAAVLYKDHLKNKQAAAQCLERGGLYMEAIALYKELNHFEKAGDLYQLAGQEDKAMHYYNLSADHALLSKDYLEAARVYENKTADPGKAEATLLKGWLQSYQSEACLSKYFAILDDRDDVVLSNEIKKIYQNQVPTAKQTSFLNVLLSVKEKDKYDINNTTTEIAYEILSRQASKGNARNLHLLNHFIKNDKLLASDCFRFKSRQPEPLKTQQDAVHQLMANVYWMDATTRPGQVLILGITGSQVVLLRRNWDRNVSYHYWSLHDSQGLELRFVPGAYELGTAFIRASTSLLLGQKILPEDQHFPAKVLVANPQWLSLDDPCVHTTGEEFSVMRQGKVVVLEHFKRINTMAGKFDCRLENGEPTVFSPDSVLTDLIFLKEHFFIANGDTLYQVTKEGKAKMIELPDEVTTIASNGIDRIAARTLSGTIQFTWHEGELHTGELFASDLDVQRLVYLPNDLLILAEDKRVVLFDCSHEAPSELSYVTTDDSIVAIVPGPERANFAILESHGRFSVHTDASRSAV